MSASELGLVLWLFPVSWVVHDAEELATMVSWREANDVEVQRFANRSRIAARLIGSMPTETTGLAVSVTLVGLVIIAVTAAATIDPRGIGLHVFSVALGGYTLHAGVHFAQSVVFRGYTPGVVTAFVAVLPGGGYVYWRLVDAGTLQLTTAVWTAVLGLAVFPVLVFAVHRVSRRVIAPRLDDERTCPGR